MKDLRGPCLTSGGACPDNNQCAYRAEHNRKNSGCLEARHQMCLSIQSSYLLYDRVLVLMRIVIKYLEMISDLLYILLRQSSACCDTHERIWGYCKLSISLRYIPTPHDILSLQGFARSIGRGV